MASNFSMTSTELGGAMSTFNEKYGHDGNKILSIFSYNTLGITINDCIDYFNLKVPNFRLHAFQCSAVEKVSLAMRRFKELKPT